MDLRVGYYTPFFVAAILILIIAIFIYKRRRVAGSWYLIFVCITASFWATTEGLLFLGSDLKTNMLIVKFQYLGIAPLSPLCLLFILTFFGFNSWITSKRLFLLSVIAVSIIILVWTNSLHNLIFTDIYTIDSGPFPMLGLKHGILWWIILGYHYCILAIISIILLYQSFYSVGFYRSQAVLLLVAVANVWIANAVYVSGKSPIPNMDIGPIAFIMVAVAMAWGFLRYEFLDVLPIAKSAIFCSLKDTILVLDEKDRIVDMNPAAESMLNIGITEIVGLKIQKVFSDYSKFHKLPDKSMHTQVSMIIEHHERMFDMYVSILNDKKGTIFGKVVVLHDITERKQAEDSLRESEGQLKSILEANPNPVVVYDMEGHPKFLNPSFTNVFGWTIDELKEGKIPFVPEDQKDLTTFKIEEIFSSGNPVKFLTQRYTKYGTTLDIFLSAAIIKNSADESAGMVVNLIDISEQRKLETQLQQAQKMESIGTLAGGIAHNFNNVLMGIQGCASLMMIDKNDSDPDVVHLKGIEEYVRNASDLTKDLLGFARGGKYEVKPTDLNALIKTQNRMFGQTKKEIQIRGKYEKNLWTVEVDQGQIQQVLLNLYVNAWQAMADGGNLYIQTENITIDESYSKSFDITPGKYVKISVTDTGIGMDNAVQKKIFDPFFTTKEIGQGSGLGLASVYGIIKNHGGFINTYSEKGEGTTFKIYLPSSEKRVVDEAPKSVQRKIQYGQETILFVDDEKMVLDVGQRMLEKLGYNVLTAQGGEEALDVYKKQNQEIDLVLMDMIMPGMGGGEAFDKMKEIDEDVSVLLSSGYSINGHAQEIIDQGCRGFIQKPFSLNDLSIKIRETLGDTCNSDDL